jgi:hypothetical protein
VNKLHGPAALPTSAAAIGDMATCERCATMWIIRKLNAPLERLDNPSRGRWTGYVEFCHACLSPEERLQVVATGKLER